MESHSGVPIRLGVHCRVRSKGVGIMIESGDREEIWGKHWGFCAWCVDTEINGDPKWEFGVDSRGSDVAYACCDQCYEERSPHTTEGVGS